MGGSRQMKRVAILGSTGSIGQSALAVVEAHPDRLRVVGLAAGENAVRFAEQVARFSPGIIAMATADALAGVRAELHRTAGGVPEPRSGSGPDALIAVATDPDADIVLFASSGTAALDAVLAAIEAGKTIALANKEILVMAGA
ncbi:MAG: 1-deoxy-D-xylulose-5-phosphate reductoisomerase, partial [Acidobacteriota bacterium]